MSADPDVEEVYSWFCERCFQEKSPLQVTYDQRCTLCGQPVQWCRWNPEKEQWDSEDE